MTTLHSTSFSLDVLKHWEACKQAMCISVKTPQNVLVYIPNQVQRILGHLGLQLQGSSAGNASRGRMCTFSWSTFQRYLFTYGLWGSKRG